jgi:hypothetical protein
VSLPAWQQRVLDRMEGALQASEPRLASMFAIFARLNAGEPVGAEPLGRPRRRPRRSPSGPAFYAVFLIPVMFAMILAVLLGSSTSSSAKTCGAGYPVVGGGLSLVNRPSCLAADETASGKTASQKMVSAAAHRSCIAAARSARPPVRAASALAFSPPAQTSTVAEGPTKTC